MLASSSTTEASSIDSDCILYRNREDWSKHAIIRAFGTLQGRFHRAQAKYPLPVFKRTVRNKLSFPRNALQPPTFETIVTHGPIIETIETNQLGWIVNIDSAGEYINNISGDGVHPDTKIEQMYVTHRGRLKILITDVTADRRDLGVNPIRALLTSTRNVITTDEDDMLTIEYTTPYFFVTMFNSLHGMFYIKCDEDKVPEIKLILQVMLSIVSEWRMHPVKIVAPHQSIDLRHLSIGVTPLLYEPGVRFTVVDFKFKAHLAFGKQQLCLGLVMILPLFYFSKYLVSFSYPVPPPTAVLDAPRISVTTEDTFSITTFSTDTGIMTLWQVDDEDVKLTNISYTVHYVRIVIGGGDGLLNSDQEVVYSPKNNTIAVRNLNTMNSIVVLQMLTLINQPASLETTVDVSAFINSFLQFVGHDGVHLPAICITTKHNYTVAQAPILGYNVYGSEIVWRLYKGPSDMYTSLNLGENPPTPLSPSRSLGQFDMASIPVLHQYRATNRATATYIFYNVSQVMAAALSNNYHATWNVNDSGGGHVLIRGPAFPIDEPSVIAAPRSPFRILPVTLNNSKFTGGLGRVPPLQNPLMFGARQTVLEGHCVDNISDAHMMTIEKAGLDTYLKLVGVNGHRPKLIMDGIKYYKQTGFYHVYYDCAIYLGSYFLKLQDDVTSTTNVSKCRDAFIHTMNTRITNMNPGDIITGIDFKLTPYNNIRGLVEWLTVSTAIVQSKCMRGLLLSRNFMSSTIKSNMRMVNINTVILKSIFYNSQTWDSALVLYASAFGDVYIMDPVGSLEIHSKKSLCLYRIIRVIRSGVHPIITVTVDEEYGPTQVFTCGNSPLYVTTNKDVLRYDTKAPLICMTTGENCWSPFDGNSKNNWWRYKNERHHVMFISTDIRWDYIPTDCHNYREDDVDANRDLTKQAAVVIKDCIFDDEYLKLKGRGYANKLLFHRSFDRYVTKLTFTEMGLVHSSHKAVRRIIHAGHNVTLEEDFNYDSDPGGSVAYLNWTFISDRGDLLFKRFTVIKLRQGEHDANDVNRPLIIITECPWLLRDDESIGPGVWARRGIARDVKIVSNLNILLPLMHNTFNVHDAVSLQVETRKHDIDIILHIILYLASIHINKRVEVFINDPETPRNNIMRDVHYGRSVPSVIALRLDVADKALCSYIMRLNPAIHWVERGEWAVMTNNDNGWSLNFIEGTVVQLDQFVIDNLEFIKTKYNQYAIPFASDPINPTNDFNLPFWFMVSDPYKIVERLPMHPFFYNSDKYAELILGDKILEQQITNEIQLDPQMSPDNLYIHINQFRDLDLTVTDLKSIIFMSPPTSIVKKGDTIRLNVGDTHYEQHRILVWADYHVAIRFIPRSDTWLGSEVDVTGTRLYTLNALLQFNGLGGEEPTVDLDTVIDMADFVGMLRLFLIVSTIELRTITFRYINIYGRKAMQRYTQNVILDFMLKPFSIKSNVYTPTLTTLPKRKKEYIPLSLLDNNLAYEIYRLKTGTSDIALTTRIARLNNYDMNDNRWVGGILFQMKHGMNVDAIFYNDNLMTMLLTYQNTLHAR